MVIIAQNSILSLDVQIEWLIKYYALNWDRDSVAATGPGNPFHIRMVDGKNECLYESNNLVAGCKNLWGWPREMLFKLE